MFPLGNYLKDDVRKVAKKADLFAEKKAESQDFYPPKHGAGPTSPTAFAFIAASSCAVAMAVAQVANGYLRLSATGFARGTPQRRL